MTNHEAHATQESQGQDLVIERVFEAPRDRVWDAWTKPDLMMRWWGPKSFTAPAARIDLRKGGSYLLCMRSPDGKDYWSTGVYREIAPKERIVYTDSFADEDGNVVPASYYGMPDDLALEFLVTLTFEQVSAKQTKFTLRHEGFPAGEHAEMARVGWEMSFDKLAAALK